MALYVYILLCSDKTYYTGVTRNIEKRLVSHNLKQSPNAYTASRLPLILKWQRLFQNNLEAIAWEKKIKGWSHKKKEALIEGRLDDLPGLSFCRNDTHFKVILNKETGKLP